MYGMPQPNSYAQYGYTGFGAPGAAPGMPQTATGAAGLGNGAQPGGADPAAGQGQWPSDPSSYYNNYWGGELLFFH